VVFKLVTNPVTLIPRKPEYDRARDRVLTDEELRHLWQGANMFRWRSAGSKDDEVIEELREIKEHLGIPDNT
jgi:hypothetical protein